MRSLLAWQYCLGARYALTVIEDLAIRVKRVNLENEEYDRLRSKIIDDKPGNYTNKDGILYYKDRLYIPDSLVIKVLKDVYN